MTQHSTAQHSTAQHSTAQHSTDIFVINLAKSTERKYFISEQFRVLSEATNQRLPYQFFNAINGKENPDFFLFQKYNEHKRLKIRANKLSLPQLGCWASHYLLWEKCVALNKPIIIIEDDAIINPNFLDAYNFLSSNQNDFEFLWLGKPSNFKLTQKNKVIYQIPNSKNRVANFYDKWANTVSYFITPQAAKKLLNHCQEWIYEVDTQMERYWETNIPYLAIFPFCIEQDLSKESDISPYNHKEKIAFTHKLRREYFRILDHINKFFFDLFRG
ncbi:glycosyl transferase [[Haemophilus] felis]|nr:glycosyl transferase [[Haemophilus] felis]